MSIMLVVSIRVSCVYHVSCVYQGQLCLSGSVVSIVPTSDNAFGLITSLIAEYSKLNIKH